MKLRAFKIAIINIGKPQSFYRYVRHPLGIRNWEDTQGIISLIVLFTAIVKT